MSNKTQKLINRKHTTQAVLNLLWAIRNNDKFYFDTYGKLWLNEMIKEHIKTTKNENSK
jgi:hypothetical protein